MNAAPVAAAAALPSIGGAVFDLVLVLALIWALAWLLKRVRGQGGPARGPLRVKASLALSMKERIVLVDAAGEHLLLGVSAAGVTCLHKYAAPPVETPQPEFQFPALLRRTSNKENPRAA